MPCRHFYRKRSDWSYGPVNRSFWRGAESGEVCTLTGRDDEPTLPAAEHDSHVGLFTRGIRLGQQVLCSAATKWRTEVERITEKASSLQPGEGALLQLTPFCLVLVLSSAIPEQRKKRKKKSSSSHSNLQASRRPPNERLRVCCED
ncbi:hypothetical protein C0Q70_10862 [Pomacea canaliculata]|uniref:Uncharacterized protein n=1 Tax=Pomacea canaliculata TaxID=400727 RepID=A0A2T7P4C3_POMCA|nr:hypothetical protein C0Q70_10862 [Pomacea canaliculata]